LNRDNRKKQDEVIMNEDIRFKEVRCNGDDGQTFGIISSREAQTLANEAGLDLVCIAPNGKPPVVKIMDYGKFKYQQEKKKKEARKNQKVIITKELKFSIKIAQNDINYKIKHAREFLEKGNHVKFRVFLKGREMQSPKAGIDVLKKLIPLIDDIGSVEMNPKFEGRYINMLIVPQKKKTLTI